MSNKFFNLKAKVYENKRNGQLSLVLPRKKMKRFLKNQKEVPKEVKISLWDKI